MLSLLTAALLSQAAIAGSFTGTAASFTSTAAAGETGINFSNGGAKLCFNNGTYCLKYDSTKTATLSDSSFAVSGGKTLIASGASYGLYLDGVGTTAHVYWGGTNIITDVGWLFQLDVASTGTVSTNKALGFSGASSLTTCNAAAEGLKRWKTGTGGATGTRTTICVCISDGASNYSWKDEADYTTGC